MGNNMIIDYLIETLQESDKYDFQKGDCNVYALALHNKYGYPIYGTVTTGRNKVFTHVFVLDPQTKKFIDSDGEFSKDEMLEKSKITESPVKIVPLTEEKAKLVFFEPDIDPSISLYADEDEIEDMINSSKTKYEKTIDAKVNDVEANYIPQDNQ
jgi:hypothetical protein